MFLLSVVVTDAQTHTGDVQNHLLKGRGEIVEKNYILFIQNSLERAEVAMYSVLGINTSVETSTISNLLTDQFFEIERLASSLSGQEAYNCTLGTLERATDAVSESGFLFEKCVFQNLRKVQEIVNYLKDLQCSYRNQIVELSLSLIEQCAVDALKTSNPGEAARLCINSCLEDFFNSTLYVKAVLLSLDEYINKALSVIPTCTDKARSYALLTVNNLLTSEGQCVEDYGVHIEIKKFPDYFPSLSDCVPYLYMFDFNSSEDLSVGVLGLTRLLVYVHRKIYGQAKQVTLDYINEVTERYFWFEIGLIRNASLIEGLTSKQIDLVTDAVRVMNSTILRGADEWLLSISNYSNWIYEHLLTAEELNDTVTQTVKETGIAAFMCCITQNTANVTAAVSCISSRASAFNEYVDKIYKVVDVKLEAVYDPTRYRRIFLTNTKVALDRIIINLKTNLLHLLVPEDREVYSSKLIIPQERKPKIIIPDETQIRLLSYLHDRENK